MHFQNANSTDVERKINKKKIAILPVGAVEAHGPHLPLGTDTILAERLSEKLSKRIDAFVLPSIAYGQVWSLRNFPGSINISNETLISLIQDIGNSVYKQGFSCLVIVNGHLGNQVAVKEAARKIYEVNPSFKLFYFFYPGMNDVLEDIRESKEIHSTYFHACEIETSIMLYLASEYVDMDKAVNETPLIPKAADYSPTPWEAFTSTGVLGNAKLATSKKGEIIINKSLSKMTKLINDFLR